VLAYRSLNVPAAPSSIIGKSMHVSAIPAYAGCQTNYRPLKMLIWVGIAREDLHLLKGYNATVGLLT